MFAILLVQIREYEQYPTQKSLKVKYKEMCL